MRALIVVAAMTGTAAAQPACGPTAQVMAQLEGRWGEARTGYGMAGDVLAQLLVNPATGTWTMTLSAASGTTCIVAAGTDWIAQAARPKPNG